MEDKGKRPKTVSKGKALLPQSVEQEPLNDHSTKVKNESKNDNPIYNYDICNNGEASIETDKLKEDRQLCVKCPLHGQPYVGGKGGKKGGVMLVGDTPGQTDAQSGRVTTG